MDFVFYLFARHQSPFADASVFSSSLFSLHVAKSVDFIRMVNRTKVFLKTIDFVQWLRCVGIQFRSRTFCNHSGCSVELCESDSVCIGETSTVIRNNWTGFVFSCRVYLPLCTMLPDLDKLSIFPLASTRNRSAAIRLFPASSLYSTLYYLRSTYYGSLDMHPPMGHLCCATK